MTNKISAILAGIVILCAVYIGYNYGQEKQRRAAWKEKEKTYQEEIARKDSALKIIGEENMILRASIAEHDIRIAKLEEDIVRQKLQIAEDEKKLRKLSPEDLVVEVRKIMSTNEIWLETNGVRFSFGSFTDAAVRINREQKLTMEYIPTLENEISELKFEVADLKKLDSNHTIEIKSWSEKFNLLQNHFNEYKKLKEKSWFAKFLDTSTKIGGGFLFGFVVGHIVK